MKILAILYCWNTLKNTEKKTEIISEQFLQVQTDRYDMVWYVGFNIPLDTFQDQNSCLRLSTKKWIALVMCQTNETF